MWVVEVVDCILIVIYTTRAEGQARGGVKGASRKLRKLRKPLKARGCCVNSAVQITLCKSIKTLVTTCNVYCKNVQNLHQMYVVRNQLVIVPRQHM